MSGFYPWVPVAYNNALCRCIQIQAPLHGISWAYCDPFKDRKGRTAGGSSGCGMEVKLLREQVVRRNSPWHILRTLLISRWLIVTSIYGKKFIQFQSALQRMINRNQGKAGFSVSVFSFFFYKLWLITSSFFVLMFPVFQLRIKLAFHVFFLFISTNEYFLSPMHMKN